MISRNLLNIIYADKYIYLIPFNIDQDGSPLKRELFESELNEILKKYTKFSFFNEYFYLHLPYPKNDQSTLRQTRYFLHKCKDRSNIYKMGVIDKTTCKECNQEVPSAVILKITYEHEKWKNSNTC